MTSWGTKIWPVLRHRFVAIPLALAVIAGAWNTYVAFHNDGLIAGTVMDAAGQPVANAEVIFFERSVLNYVEERRTRSDAGGAWHFDNMAVHVGQLEARTPDGRKSERRQLLLWFRAQNTNVAPLVVR